MNSTFKFKLIQALNKKNRNKGFTLIELLVVVIIIGVLAAIALPNLLGQVARGRQAEARNNLGTINRTQQAFRLENGTFGTFSTDAAANQLPVSLQPQYYEYNESEVPDATAAGTDAVAIGDYQDDIRDYDSGVGQTAEGVFSSVICESTSPTADDADAANNGTCTAGEEVN
ncbi:MAG: prepilin-type N-terminal cleavage/methylation domain-containing protein [Chroococcales cyanobacterium metabat2.561]|nr:MAG: prepilin-type N-terminal cleavage/methylation domain-containing protein [Chroococcales cyanobacterium metabat2.561]